MAEQANRIGRHDAVIHNAGIGFRRPARETSEDGHELTFAVNVLAAYVLTALVDRPGRLVYLSSGMHRGGTPNLDDVEWTKRRWNGAQAYSDTKLFDVALAFGMARRWPDVLSNAVEPGWVATKMGGAWRPRRPGGGAGHAVLAGRERGPGGEDDRRLLVPPAAAGRPPGRLGSPVPGRADRLLRVAQRGAAARLTRAATSGPGGRPRRRGGGRGGRSA